MLNYQRVSFGSSILWCRWCRHFLQPLRHRSIPSSSRLRSGWTSSFGDHTLGYLELPDLTRDVATGVRSQGWITAPLSALVMWESVAYSRLGLNLCHRPKPGWYWAAAPSPCYCRFDHKWRHIVNIVSLRSREPQELKQKKWLLQVCIYRYYMYIICINIMLLGYSGYSMTWSIPMPVPWRPWGEEIFEVGQDWQCEQELPDPWIIHLQYGNNVVFPLKPWYWYFCCWNVLK